MKNEVLKFLDNQNFEISDKEAVNLAQAFIINDMELSKRMADLALKGLKNQNPKETTIAIQVSKQIKDEFIMVGKQQFFHEMDIYLPRVKLNIEIDGSQHLFKEERDKYRDQFLAKKGITVIRISSVGKNDKNLINEIVESIKCFLKEKSK